MRAALLIHLQCDDRVLPLTVFPLERLVHCPLPMAQFLALPPARLSVLHVEPALLRPPGDRERPLVGERSTTRAARRRCCGSWRCAARATNCCPRSPARRPTASRRALDLRVPGLSGALAAAVARLQRDTTNLREIADWPGFDRERAMRLLNALYLQAGLIVSRTHPAATNDGWFAAAAADSRRRGQRADSASQRSSAASSSSSICA